jgi:hypothetical protein
MIPEEAVHPPFEPTPEQANPWDHIAPKFTVIPDYLDRVVDGTLQPYGGSMDTFLQALDDEKVAPEDMVTLTDALEKIQTFLESPPKDPDFEHLTLKREIKLDTLLNNWEHPKVLLITNEGDIVAATHDRIIRLDKDGNLLYKLEIEVELSNLLYEPIHDTVFFTIFSKEFVHVLHKLDNHGVVSDPLSTSEHYMRILPDPQGDLLLLQSKTHTISGDLSISKFNLDTWEKTVTHDIHISGTWKPSSYIQKNGLLVLYGGHTLSFFDTKTGTVKEMTYDGGESISVDELPDGTIACVGNDRDSASYGVIDPSIPFIKESNYTYFPDYVAMSSLVLTRTGILPSGKIVQVNYFAAPSGEKGYFLQRWDTTTGTMDDVFKLSERPTAFCTAPDGKIVVAFISERGVRKIHMYG